MNKTLSFASVLIAVAWRKRDVSCESTDLFMWKRNEFRFIVSTGCGTWGWDVRKLRQWQTIMVYQDTTRPFLESKMARRHTSHRVVSGQEEWQMARNWLSSLAVLPDFHRASFPNASVFDLAQSLRDGVVLCQVANRLRPNSVPDINMKPQMSPVCSFVICGSLFCDTICGYEA